MTPCGSCKNWCFAGTYRLHNQGEKNQRTTNSLSSVLQFLVTANVVPGSLILFTLMKEAIRSSERWFLHEPHGVTCQKTAFFCTELASWNSGWIVKIRTAVGIGHLLLSLVIMSTAGAVVQDGWVRNRLNPVAALVLLCSQATFTSQLVRWCYILQ
jgi:hypothetical protein